MVASGSAILSGEISDVSAIGGPAYTIEGPLIVLEGGELHIPPVTHLYGSTDIQPSALIVRVGGKLFSEGTERPGRFHQRQPARGAKRVTGAASSSTVRRSTFLPASASGKHGDLGATGGTTIPV